MKIIKLTCHNCGANLELKENFAFCSYCGAKLLIDDEHKRTTHTYVHRDEGEIRDSERKETIRLKELEYEDKQREREQKERMWIGMCWAIIGAVSLLILLILSFFE